MPRLVQLHISKTTEIDRGEKFILAQLAALGNGASVTTGIHTADFNKVQTFRGKRVGKTSVGVYAAFNEFGTRFSPPRPFMRQTLDRNVNLYTKQTAAGMRSLYNSQLTASALLLRQAGRTKKWMRRSIRTWTPGNSSNTRKINKRNSTSPLMDTRTMLKSVTSDVQRKGGGLIPDFRKFLRLADRIVMMRGGTLG